jgi:hypothetical protein
MQILVGPNCFSAGNDIETHRSSNKRKGSNSMNILYGVQATGNGHISRSREVIRNLKMLGHKVRVILSGRDPALLWDMEVFEPYDAFRGLTFKKLSLGGLPRRSSLASFQPADIASNYPASSG